MHHLITAWSGSVNISLELGIFCVFIRLRQAGLVSFVMIGPGTEKKNT
jgi:hypothetical protein